MAIFKNSEPVIDLPQWRRLAGPKSRHHWIAGRSAMEAARFWLGAAADLPSLLADPLARHGDFGATTSWTGEPEVRLAFDRRRGERRNTDLLVAACDEFGPYILAVEAKVDETFGETVAEAFEAALERRLSNPRSRGVERIVDLAQTLAPPAAKGVPALASLRYQLLTGTAGALAEGIRRAVDRVVFVVQEFRTDETSPTEQARNCSDLVAFVQRITSGVVQGIQDGVVIGPLRVSGKPLFEARPPRLYFLKVTCDLRREADHSRFDMRSAGLPAERTPDNLP